ncbi:MAG TPA: glycosyltransferase family 87 protein [Candidatus Limnocylindria bacterium]|jgi:hypothetical protein|nr:glycosyltransferase family 87 protein [Candidatus Limnocylindria bacterium]
MRARVAWWIYAAIASALAFVVVGSWISAVALRGPVLYGEGAVAHAAILARDRLEYTTGAHYGDVPPIFTAANYPPLFFHLAGLGDPFEVGRLISIGATLFIACAIALRARPAGAVVAGAIALAWLASVPVMQWGLAVKPDPLALALTVGATLALARARPLPVVAGVLIGVAVMTKPTALLPGVALLAYVARRDPVVATGGLVGGFVAAIVVALLTYGPDKAFKLHVIDWNALPWHPELLLPLALIALLVLAVPAVTIVALRAGGGPVGAYLIGAMGVMLLGGREGATVNYFLDLSAALALAAATIAPRLALSLGYPVASLVQFAIAFALLNPFPTTPSLLQPTGKWADPSQVAYIRDHVPGTLLAEDSGLLVANGREPIVDDLFLWSRIYASDGSFREGRLLLDAVRTARFDAIVSEVELERIDVGPGYERQRWHPDLVAAVLERYELPPRRVFGLCPAFVWCRQLFVYIPR